MQTRVTGFVAEDARGSGEQLNQVQLVEQVVLEPQNQPSYLVTFDVTRTVACRSPDRDQVGEIARAR